MDVSCCPSNHSPTPRVIRWENNLTSIAGPGIVQDIYEVYYS